MRHIQLLIAAAFVAAAALGILLVPSAPGERAAHAAVQQPFQCPPTAFWDLFSPHYYFVDTGEAELIVAPIEPVDDVAPRNDPRYASGPKLLGFSVPFDGVMQNDNFRDALSEGSEGRPEVRLVEPPSQAKDFSLNADGSYSYTPVDGYFGGDSFKYGFRDPAGSCFGRIATVTIPPVGGRLYDDSYTLRNDQVFNSPLICSVIGCGVRYNDFGTGAVSSFEFDHEVGGTRCGDVGFDLELVVAQGVNVGVLRLVNQFGSFRFTPQPGFVGTIEFFYTTEPMHDLGLHEWTCPNIAPGRAGKVTLNVVAAPAIVPGYTPLAIDDDLTTDEDTQLSFAPDALLANDVGGKYGGLVLSATPAHGSLGEHLCTQFEWLNGTCTRLNEVDALFYTPHPNYHGVDSFNYQVVSTDPERPNNQTATVRIVVNPARDQPILQADPFTAKRGEPTVLDVLANDFDPDGLIDRSRLGRQAATGDDAGLLTLQGDKFVYTANGTALQKVFSYGIWTLEEPPVALDGTTFTVNVDPNPAADDSYTTNEDTPLTRTAAQGVLANDVLGTGTLAPTTGTRTTEFGFATVNPDGSFTYTPPANFSGTDTFAYGHNSDAARVTITVNSVPDAPALVLNIAECPEGLICVDRPDPDDRVNLGPGDVARLRGLISDVERDSGTIEIDWGDGEKTTRGYPCAQFETEFDCPYTLAQNQSWYPPSGLCGPASCNEAIFFDFAHVYDGQPPADGLRYNITVKTTSFVEILTSQAPTYASLADGDGDGDADQYDNCPLDANGDQADLDGDGLGDACDPDDDGDTIEDGADNCPLVFNDDQANTDGDALGDACDRDDDNDGVPDDFGIGFDNCQFVPNPDQSDTDADGEGDACDPDDDNDGLADAQDNCHLVANSDQANNDGDVQGDVCDPDDDNDGDLDGADNCQFVANASQANFDGDAQGDACDADDDNDGLADAADACDLDVAQGGRDADADGCTDTISRLRALVSSLNISKGTKSGLLGYLGEAQKLYDRGKIPQAENKLREFIVQVETRRGKGLTNAQADLLVAYANNIIADI